MNKTFSSTKPAKVQKIREKNDLKAKTCIVEYVMRFGFAEITEGDEPGWEYYEIFDTMTVSAWMKPFLATMLALAYDEAEEQILTAIEALEEEIPDVIVE